MKMGQLEREFSLTSECSFDKSKLCIKWIKDNIHRVTKRKLGGCEMKRLTVSVLVVALSLFGSVFAQAEKPDATLKLSEGRLP